MTKPDSETLNKHGPLIASWLVTAVSVLTALWAVSTSFSRLSVTQEQHSASISANTKNIAAEQTLIYSILTQNAQLQQSVADIKQSIGDIKTSLANGQK